MRRCWLFLASVAACGRDASAPAPAYEAPIEAAEAPRGPPSPRSRPATLTQHQDLARTGANLDETVLDVDAVANSSFGRLGAYAVDGQIYAQPLFVPDLASTDAVIAATEHGTVYAFDARRIGSAPLWQTSVGAPFPIREIFPSCVDLTPEIGITSTPAIDRASGTIYVTSKHLEDSKGVYRLHALDLATGRERAAVTIEGSAAGTSDDAKDGVIRFDATRHLQRPAITLAGGVLWIAFGAHCDFGPYHGWVFAYDAATLERRGTFCTTPTGDSGGVWQAGQGLSADESGDVFFMTGNGTFDGTRSFGSSFVRLHLGPSGISIASTFTPFNQEALSDADYDLGSAGILLLPGTRLLVGGGKEGRLYLLSRDALGGYSPADDARIPQSFQATRRPIASHIHGSPVYWKGPDRVHVYLWGETDVLRDFAFENGRFDPTPRVTSTATVPEGMPGAMLTLSSDRDKAKSGVVWASHPAEENSGGERIVTGILRAFDATDVSRELWNSGRRSSDGVGLHAKFAAPTVADGRVYVATFSGTLVVYGPGAH